MTESVEVVAGRYFDSVRLMQVSRDVAAVAGVEDALVAMATDLNLALLGEMGFERPEEAEANSDDLVIAIRAADAAAMAAARRAVEIALAGGRTAEPDSMFGPPESRTVATAGRRAAANLALISVPGPHAFVEAMDALQNDMHVMVFSDNVPLDQEVLLKQEAAARDLLVMGPDCGTAVVGGVGLGFANAVDLGPVGITGASGTGIQELCCLLDAAGVGVRHALGTGSRDLRSAVGAASTLRALAALDADPAVEVIIVVSKPPDADVAQTVARAIGEVGTPVVTALLGESDVTLEWAARRALELLGRPTVEFPVWRPDHLPSPRAGVVRGIFSGGTLRDEARAIAAPSLWPIAGEATADGHRMVDYGGDEFTRGRAHPMIDQSLRLDALQSAATDPATGVILLDVVLGYGAHPDPSADLAPAIGAAGDARIPVVVSLCGAVRDPQGRDRQAMALRDAGAEVFLSNAAAALRAAELVGEGDP